MRPFFFISFLCIVSVWILILSFYKELKNKYKKKRKPNKKNEEGLFLFTAFFHFSLLFCSTPTPLYTIFKPLCLYIRYTFDAIHICMYLLKLLLFSANTTLRPSIFLKVPPLYKTFAAMSPPLSVSLRIFYFPPLRQCTALCFLLSFEKKPSLIWKCIINHPLSISLRHFLFIDKLGESLIVSPRRHLVDWILTRSGK